MRPSTRQVVNEYGQVFRIEVDAQGNDILEKDGSHRISRIGGPDLGWIPQNPDFLSPTTQQRNEMESRGLFTASAVGRRAGVSPITVSKYAKRLRDSMPCFRSRHERGGSRVYELFTEHQMDGVVEYFKENPPIRGGHKNKNGRK